MTASGDDHPSAARPHACGQGRLLRRRDALALIRQRFDLDAGAAGCGARAARDISSRISKLTVRDADERVSPGDGSQGTHLERPGEISRRVKEVFRGRPGKSIAAEMHPGAVLFAERTRAV